MDDLLILEAELICACEAAKAAIEDVDIAIAFIPKEPTMLTIGLLLLAIGVLIVILSAFAPLPAPISQLGWVLLVLGVVLILLAYVLPLATVHTASALLALL